MSNQTSKIKIGGRTCTRSGCRQVATRTLVFSYQDSQAILSPLATFSEPHSYDLCEVHSHRLSLPQGWEIIKADGESAPRGPSKDDLMAIADAVREVGKKLDSQEDLDSKLPKSDLGKRGHLRAVPD